MTAFRTAKCKRTMNMPTVTLDVLFGGAEIVFAVVFVVVFAVVFTGGGAFTGDVLTFGGAFTGGGVLTLGGVLTFGGAFTLGAETLGALTALRRSRVGDSSSSSSNCGTGPVRQKEQMRKKER